MEIQEAGGLRQVERDWIQYFADNETFSINQRKEPLRQVQNGEITIEPKGIDEYQKAFIGGKKQLEIRALPPTKMTVQQLFH